jgi:hypothetical protein
MYVIYIYIYVYCISLSFGVKPLALGVFYLDYTYSVYYKYIRIIIYTHTCIYNVIHIDYTYNTVHT